MRSSSGGVGLLLPKGRRGLFEKMVEEQRQIFHALAERGDVDVMITEPVIEILAKPAVGLERVQILIRGHNDSCVRTLGHVRTEGKVLSVLQEPQEFHL